MTARKSMKLWMVGLVFGVVLAAFGGSALAQESPRLVRNRALVKDVQSALIDKGYSPGQVDGIMGPMTREALRQFQAANGLNSDGLMSDETLDRLGVAIPAKTDEDERDRGLLGDAASAVSSAAKTVAGATATGAKAAAKGTATGAKAAAGATATGATAAAKGAATGGKAVAEGATVAGKTAGSATATGAKATASAGETGGKAVVSGVKTAGSAVGDAAGATKRFLFGGSDEEEKLGRDVRAALERDRAVDASHVEVGVDGSTVTLKFKGGNSAEWNRAVVVAKRVKGVERVFVRTP